MKRWLPALFFVVLPALVAASAPEFFVYDRAAILHGEWWRLVTGHWVHFSVSHACWNLLALAAATLWLEGLRPGWTARFVALAAPAIGVGLLALTPTMAIYGGLSGLAVGAVALLAFVQLDTAKQSRARIWWLAALALIVGKLGWESVAGTPLFSRLEPSAHRVSVAAHALGLSGALVFFLATRAPAGQTPRGARARSARPRGRNPSAAR